MMWLPGAHFEVIVDQKDLGPDTLTISGKWNSTTRQNLAAHRRQVAGGPIEMRAPQQTWLSKGNIPCEAGAISTAKKHKEHP